MAYQFKAYTRDKRVVQGTIEAASEIMAEEALYRAGYQRVLGLKQMRPGLSWEQLLPTLFRIKTQDVIDFSRQLATLIESGITILTALQLLEEQAFRPVFSKVITGLVSELRGGSSFSQALSKYPQAFSYTYCQVLKAGEQAGNLEVSLRQIAGYMERQVATAKRIKGAMTYPMVVLCMAIGVFVILITVALPPLVGLFNALGTELPWMTKLLMATSDFLINYKFYLLGGAAIVAISIIGYLRLPAGKLAMDRLWLKLPLIGPINVQRNVGHFCRTTSMLLKAGLLLPQTMSIVIQTVGNRIIRQTLKEVREKLVQGQGLSQPMATIDLFPRLMVEMVSVGEKTGNLDSTLATLGDYYEQRVDQRVNTLISMIGPALTAGVGLIVAFIALSIITPLYSILGSM
jgi:type IV pilus assembly protein PilC